MKHVLLNTDAITAIAAAKGISSVSDLARRVTLSQSYVRKILHEEKPALPTHVIAFAKVLGVKPSELLDPSEAQIGEALDAAVLSERAS